MATYYLSPTGSDSNTGSLAHPWLNLTKINSLSPGDTLHLLPGNYGRANGLAITASGTSGNPITIEGDSRDTVDIFSSVPCYGFTAPAGANYLTLKDLHLRDFQYPIRFNTGVVGFTMDNVEVSGCSRHCAFETGSDLTFKNCYWHDTLGAVTLDGDIAGALMEDCIAEHMAPDGLGAPLGHGVTYESFSDTHLCLTGLGCSNIIVRDCTCDGAGDAGIDARGEILVERVHIKNSYSATGGASGFKNFGLYGSWTLRNCTIENCNDSGVRAGKGTIENCTIVDNTRCAIRPTGDLTQLVVRNTIMSDGPHSSADDYCTVRIYRNATDGTIGEHFEGDHNCLYQTSTAYFWKVHDSDKEHHSLRQMAGLDPEIEAFPHIDLGEGTIFVDPLFVNPTTGDWRVQAGSPCEGTAAVPVGYYDDLTGTTRDPADPTMGAYRGLGEADMLARLNWVGFLGWLRAEPQAATPPRGTLRFWRWAQDVWEDVEEWWWRKFPGTLLEDVVGVRPVSEDSTVYLLTTDATAYDDATDETVVPLAGSGLS